MKIASFFKILNKKIQKYENMTTNPFEMSHPIILIWIDDENESPKEVKE